MALFADANVILEILLPNRPKIKTAQELLLNNDIAISMLTVHLAHHFGHKEGHSVQEIERFLGGYRIIDLTEADYRMALGIVQNNDFEDALQLAVALRSGCEAITTLDTAFAKIYKNEIRFVVP